MRGTAGQGWSRSGEVRLGKAGQGEGRNGDKTHFIRHKRILISWRGKVWRG
jgi:hypothetical protein